MECPNQYPWLGDAEGTGISGRDNYIYTYSGGASSGSGSSGETDKEDAK